MATWKQELVEPPTEPRARELWLQHAACLIVFEDVRSYATEKIDPALSDEVCAAVQKGIDDAVYGLMMVIDGVTGAISNPSHNVYIDFIVRFATRGDSKDCLSEANLREGDGMCMGYHRWCEGDFGEYPIAVPRTDTQTQAKTLS